VTTRPRKTSTWERLWRCFPEAKSGPCAGCSVRAELGGVRSVRCTVQGTVDRHVVLQLCVRCASKPRAVQQAIRRSA
jgi:hypothetical protein